MFIIKRMMGISLSFIEKEKECILLEQQTKPVYLQSVEDVFKEVQSSPSGFKLTEAASRLENTVRTRYKKGKKNHY